MKPDEVLDRLRALRQHDAPTHGGRILSYVYDSGLPELDELAAAAAREVQSVNGLDPTVFPSSAIMEGELVAFGRRLFHGDDTVVGNVTTGGTESCILAVLGARDSATGVAGSIVVPSTAHAAFHKAAHLLGLEAVVVPVDPSSGVPDPVDVAAAVRDDTVLIVASAPNYPFGVLDPIAELASVALDHDIGLHVDACIGGLALPWWGELPAWDFAVPGVTSVSADLHKYGYAPKGASLLLVKGRDRHRHQYFGLTAWPGYPVVNPTLLGSRSVSSMAAAWAIVTYLGDDGFAELTSQMRDSTTALIAAIRAVPGLRVFGDPVGPLFAVEPDPLSPPPVDPHQWLNAVARRGFSLQAQPSLTQSDGTTLPRTTHLTVTPATVQVQGELVAALVSAADEVRGLGPAEPPAALADLATLFSDGTVTEEQAVGLSSDDVYSALQAAGVTGDGELDMASILAGIESLPRRVSARMLVEFLARVIEK
ncbi:pyridoxal phosphate-dependent decarboxylase family protein [Rhodococcoides kyotonense]|uniref:Glutamate or tyrosine decarboxylase n=1 Tax=Rhodococcoides kyotonense TaxID=398843 RepID=A0A239L421_9NOCA|nr:aminotransferase class V-fold PLP-dependent enzyme [Rhodococcus kyotonensis]SNT25347.1 Glutamate or tyrosine decarboxylase [Rhodococcus kyotonensis]